MNNTREVLSRQTPYLWAIMIVVSLSVILDPIRRFYDAHLRAVPWISAELEILPDDGDGLAVQYDLNANTVIKATWKTWLEVGPRQMCFGIGTADYSPATKRNRIWPMSEFLAVQCTMPVVPYRVCIDYTARLSSGAEAGFGPYCSEVFDPRKVTP